MEKCAFAWMQHMVYTNMYDFNLITLLVVDEFGEGIPVAWAISNREDVTLLVQFLSSIKKRTGTINPNWFMSDDAQQYYNAWSGVFGTTGTKIFYVHGTWIEPGDLP